MSAAWLAQRERGTTFALRLIVWIARALGRPVGRALLYPICAYFLCFSFASRRASCRYLACVLGRAPRAREIFRHYHTFAAVLLDRIFFLSGRGDDFMVNVTGETEMASLLSRRDGCVLLGAHFGSLDVLRMVGASRSGVELRLAMFEDNAQNVARVLGGLNPRLRETIIALGAPEAMLALKDTLDRGGIVGMLGDRVRAGGRTLRCDFLGVAADFPAGPLQVACALRRPVAIGLGVYRGDRRYDVHFETLVDTWPTERNLREHAIDDALRRYAARLEQWCRAAPCNWFNFYDFWADEP